MCVIPLAWRELPRNHELHTRYRSKRGSAQFVENLRSSLLFDSSIKSALHHLPQRLLHGLRVIQIDRFEPSLPDVLGSSPRLTRPLRPMKKTVPLVPHRRRPTPHPIPLHMLTNQHSTHTSKIRRTRATSSVTAEPLGCGNPAEVRRENKHLVGSTPKHRVLVEPEEGHSTFVK